MARLWEIREDYEPDYYDERGGKSSEWHKAFKEGCMHGYKKAMKEFEELEYRSHGTPHYSTREMEDYIDYRKMGGKR